MIMDTKLTRVATQVRTLRTFVAVVLIAIAFTFTDCENTGIFVRAVPTVPSPPPLPPLSPPPLPPPPPSPPPKNLYGKKIAIPQGEFFNAICECLREDPEKGNCLEFGYSERNAQGEIYGVLSNWNTSEITDMNAAFSFDRLRGGAGCNLLEADIDRISPDLSLWETSSVTNFDYMFDGLKAFEGKGLRFWDTSSGVSFDFMFFDCLKFVESISFWNVERATSMKGMFDGAKTFGSDISNWIVSSVTDMELMFRGAIAFNKPLKDWNVSSLMYLEYMFEDAIAFDKDITDWNTTHTLLGFQANMFRGAVAFNKKWTCQTEHGGPPSTCKLKKPYALNPLGNRRFEFKDELDTAICSCLREDPVYGKCTDFARETDYGIMPQWDVSDITDLNISFSGPRLTPIRCGLTENSVSLIDVDLSYWDVSSVTNMERTFSDLPGYRGRGLRYWDTQRLESLAFTFINSRTFNEPIGSWETSKVVTMIAMFLNCESFNQDLSKFEVSSVTDMREMFGGASKFNKGDITKWNVSSVNLGRMDDMFNGASSFAQDIGATWRGPAPESESANIFLNADAFNAKFECTTAVSGPISSCRRESPPSIWRSD